MKRDVGVQGDTKYFIGNEVEKTPALHMKTLFVNGMLDANDVVANAKYNGIHHVYLGANQSFWLDDKDASGVATPEQFRGWNNLFNKLREAEFWITLDYDLKYHSWVLEQGFNKYDKFISMISAKLPNINQLNQNARLKLDDRDFKFSNDGVWVHPVRQLKSQENITTWDEYKDDKEMQND